MIALIEHLKLAVFAPRLGTSPNLEGVYSEDFDHWATRNDGTILSVSDSDYAWPYFCNQVEDPEEYCKVLVVRKPTDKTVPQSPSTSRSQNFDLVFNYLFNADHLPWIHHVMGEYGMNPCERYHFSPYEHSQGLSEEQHDIKLWNYVPKTLIEYKIPRYPHDGVYRRWCEDGDYFV